MIEFRDLVFDAVLLICSQYVKDPVLLTGTSYLVPSAAPCFELLASLILYLLASYVHEIVSLLFIAY